MGEIKGQRDRNSLDWAKITVLDCPGQRVLIGQMLKILAEVAHIPTVRGGGDAQHPGFFKMGQYPLVAVGQGMVGFIHHNHIEVISRELTQPFLPHKALN